MKKLMFLALPLALYSQGLPIWVFPLQPPYHSVPPKVVSQVKGNGGAHGSLTSQNWSGYGVSGDTGSVTAASGSWVVPAVTCTAAGATATWVGIDGLTSSTVEQIGTDSDCYDLGGGVIVPWYYAWYEFYPAGSVPLGMPIHPGDVMSASVAYIGNGQFTVTLNNVTTGGTFNVTQTVGSTQLTSAEWITEAPTDPSSGILPLSNFGSASFGFDNTFVSNTCGATLNMTTGTIGSFGSSVTDISMTGLNEANPTALSADGISFTVNSVPSFFGGSTYVGEGLLCLAFPDSNLFGYYGFLSGAWIYHADLGYEYFTESGQQVYFCDQASGHWWYISTSLFPYLYDFTLNAWVDYLLDPSRPGHYTTNPRLFTNMTTGLTLSM